ncbi:hypothetical protein HanRHA438_Chr17g0835411 [Helianthus annuus]|nr:hypothetical protein HanRHA438_Chr17g0835411 [Helianthus annuus]
MECMKKQGVTVSTPLGNFVPKFIQEEDLGEKAFWLKESRLGSFETFRKVRNFEER